MTEKYVSWKDWAETQVSVAILQERVRGLQGDVQSMRTEMVHQHHKAPAVDWKWWVQITIIIVVISFVLIANTNEDLAREILRTIQAVLKH